MCWEKEQSDKDSKDMNAGTQELKLCSLKIEGFTRFFLKSKTRAYMKNVIIQEQKQK